MRLINPIIPGEYRYPTITPFTIPDGHTYLKSLEHLVKVMKTLIDSVNENSEEMQTFVIELINNKIEEINTAFTEFDGEIDDKIASVDAKISELETFVTTEISELETFVNDSVNSIINNSIEVQDPVVASIIGDENSESRKLTDALYGRHVDYSTYIFSQIKELSRFNSGEGVRQPNFNDLSEWYYYPEGTEDKFTVQDGELYSNWDTGDGNPFISRNFTALPTETFRVSARFRVPEVGTGSQATYAMVAVAPYAPIGVDAPNGLFGVGVNSLNQPILRFHPTQGAHDQIASSTPLQPGEYTGTITANIESVSLTLTNDDGSVEFRRRLNNRNSFTSSLSDTPGQLYSVAINNRDPRHLSGVSIMSIDAHVESTRTIEQAGAGYREHTWVTVKGDAVRADIPANYDPRTPSELVLFAHGSGRGSQDIGNENTAELIKALVDYGYIVAVPGMFSQSPWGNPNSVQSLKDTYDYISNSYSIKKVHVMGASAGVLSALTAIHRDLIPVNSFYSFYGVTNLLHQYENNAGHRDNIRSAFGFTTDAQYEEYTAGYDPMTLSVSGYPQVPMRFSASYGDTAVNTEFNTDEFINYLSPYNTRMSVVYGEGAHGSPSTTVLSDVLNFIQNV